ncbi:hypothetical protein [Vitiosangium sp. GDMCC 1.1324]|uniref:hypothetical protein n=1 Tax=Vitiosangium sp. (strain GDMCC 1.1324) TaxID=2138576 RepID=UPI0011B7F71D|nr:hypothetical protein [Vitiosangium sp. GDMCC 1.1324]
MRTRIVALVLAFAAGLAGCNATPPEECTPPPQPVMNGQGAVYRCVASEDCPRSSRVSLCVSDTGTQEECIRCLNTECVRVIPEAC